MTNNKPKHDMPGGDRSEFCPVCNQHLILEGCTETQCNSRGESEDERHRLPGSARRWDVDAESTWEWVEEDNER